MSRSIFGLMGKPPWTATRAPRRGKIPITYSGDAGHVEVSSAGAFWVPRKGKRVELPGGLWAITMTPSGPIAFAKDGTPWTLRGKDFVAVAAAPAGFAPRSRTTAGWDPTQNATLLFSGLPDKGKAKLKDAWAFDGKAMSKVPIVPPIRVIDGGAAFSPALGALVVAGGREVWQGAPPAPTYEVRGVRSKSYPPAPFMWSMWMVTDHASGLVVATGADKPGWGESWLASVYLGSGTWRALPATPAGTQSVVFDPTTRELRAVVKADAMRSDHACAIGPLLDKLKPRAA
jgi:hypothetical protein